MTIPVPSFLCLSETQPEESVIPAFAVGSWLAGAQLRLQRVWLERPAVAADAWLEFPMESALIP
jgi:hypothetical protein